VTDRDRKPSPTPQPFERAAMSDRRLIEFVLDRTEGLQEGISDLALTQARNHGEIKTAIERMSYVAMRLEERADELETVQKEHTKAIDKIERRILVIGATCSGAGIVGGLLFKLLSGG
jgi:hypothetical protein